MAGRIRVEKEGAIGWIVFDHPERHNAITSDMWEAVPGAAQDLAEDPDVRVPSCEARESGPSFRAPTFRSSRSSARATAR